MKAALAVIEVGTDPDTNVRKICAATRRAAGAGSDLVLFGEAVLTGLVNRDDPTHDLALGQPIPGPATETLGHLAAELGLFVGLGLLERAGDCLYDSAVLLGPGGDLLLHHRRIQPDWHGGRADHRVYCQGQLPSAVETELGTLAFLLCGDLFDNAILEAARGLQADCILYPCWRCFEDGTTDDLQWQLEEAEDYAERVAELDTPTLMVNALAPATMAGGAFGGAFVFGGQGRTLERLPLGREGMLVVEMPPMRLVRPR